MKASPKQAGFSLLELILVIVLLGVLASGAGLLITTPIQAYNDQLRRTQLVDQAEMSLRQVARDVRRGLPNSIRFQLVGAGWALEMVNTVAGARYRDEADASVGAIFTAPFHILDFSQGDTDFNFLGSLLPGVTAIPAGQRLVIYNTVPDNFYMAAAANNNAAIVTPANATLSLSTIGTEQHINIAPLAPNPAFQFTQQSPGQRAFLVDGPISYLCNPLAGQTKLTRYDNYAYRAVQPTTAAIFAGLPGGSNSGDVTTGINACTINYDAGTAQRGGIITLGLTIGDAASDESISLLHQIHVVNVP